MSKWNGWTNAATWRVQLEVFSGLEAHDTVRRLNQLGSDDVANWAHTYARTFVLQNADGLARDWALDYLSGVNWAEIAQHLIDAAKEEAA